MDISYKDLKELADHGSLKLEVLTEDIVIVGFTVAEYKLQLQFSSGLEGLYALKCEDEDVESILTVLKDHLPLKSLNL